MKLFQCLVVGAAMVMIAAGSYFAGSLTNPAIGPASLPPVSVPKLETAELVVPRVFAPSSVTKYQHILDEIQNPTDVLLGKAKVPDVLLLGPTPSPTAVEGLIIPRITK